MKSLVCSVLLFAAASSAQPVPPAPPPPSLGESLGELIGRQVELAIEESLSETLVALAQVAPAPPAPPSPPNLPHRAEMVREMMREHGKSMGSEDRYYRSGQSELEDREWDDAAKHFQRVIDLKGTKADGAMYWKSYALYKQGRRDEALQTLTELARTHPNSRWLNDARLLEAEVKRASGQELSPEAQTDEDIKLYAINSLIYTEPERAVPLLERVLQSASAPRLQQRALFVAAQSKSPQARDLVMKYARGAGNPDLQAKAVEYLGLYKENAQTLSEIYGSTTDTAVKRSVLRGFAQMRDKDRLISVARSETTPELRRAAIDYLGSMNAQDELAQMYAGESDQKNKAQIISALAQGKSATRLVEIARSEKDPQLKKVAVQHLSRMKSKEAQDFLIELLNK